MSNRSKNRKISGFIGQPAIPANAEITYISNKTNYRIPLVDFIASIGVTGTIVQEGDPLGTPILNTVGTINNIRNLEPGSGIKTSVSPQGGAIIEQDFIENIVGVTLIEDLTADQPNFRSLVAGAGLNISGSGGEIQIALSGIPVSTKTVIVNAITDFPTAVSGVITLADDTEYAVRNDITTSDRFVWGNNCVISGSDNIVVALTYSGSGIMFTSTNSSWTTKNITINCTAGTFIDFDGSGLEIMQLKNSVINADIFGTIDDFAGIHIDDVQYVLTTNGILFGGVNGVILTESALGSIEAGVLFDLGTAVFSGFSITDGFNTLNGASIFMSGLVSSGNISAGNLGAVHNCRFFGTGTVLQTITTFDIGWNFAVNDVVADTHQDCLMSQVANVTATVIAVATTPVKLAGSWIEEHLSQFTTDATGKMTYGGAKDIHIDITMSFSAAPVSGTNKSVNFYAGLNGTFIPNSRAYNNLSSGNPSRTTLVWRTPMSTGDYIEAFVANDTDIINILVSDAVLRIS